MFFQNFKTYIFAVPATMDSVLVIIYDFFWYRLMSWFIHYVQTISLRKHYRGNVSRDTNFNHNYDDDDDIHHFIQISILLNSIFIMNISRIFRNNQQGAHNRHQLWFISATSHMLRRHNARKLFPFCNREIAFVEKTYVDRKQIFFSLHHLNALAASFKSESDRLTV